MTLCLNGERRAMCNLMFRCLCLGVCLVLSGCNIPLLFWEEEVREVVDDIVDEEEKIQGHSSYPEKEMRTP